MNETKVKPIPEGYHTITPYLVVENALGLVEFIEKAFNGKVTYMMKSGDGKLQHGDMLIGNSHIMISEGTGEYPPKNAMLLLYVDDVDAMYNKAIEAGGKSLREPTNEYYGDRSSGLIDDWGNQWWLATHVEDVSEEEMEKRMKEAKQG